LQFLESEPNYKLNYWMEMGLGKAYTCKMLTCTSSRTIRSR